MRPGQKFIDLRMSLGNYKILNPSRTFSARLNFFPPSLFTAFHLTKLEKKSYKWVSAEKKDAANQDCGHFWFLLLCFSVVFVGHIRSLNDAKVPGNWRMWLWWNHVEPCATMWNQGNLGREVCGMSLLPGTLAPLSFWCLFQHSGDDKYLSAAFH